MLFTTVDSIRAESWFNWNSDISDNYINWYLIQANWVLLSYVATIYNANNLTWLLFIWSQAESFLQRIETILASGYLLINEYWIDSRGTDKDWYIKKKDALNMLQEITEWKTNLFDVNFNEFSKKSIAVAWGIVMTTPDDNLNLKPTFTTNMEF